MMNSNAIYPQLKDALMKPLPGLDAQLMMAPIGRKNQITQAQNPKKAATMLCLFEQDEEWYTIFILRSSHPLDKHKGQISFPGGSLELGESHEQAAIRELHEEIGIPESRLLMQGALSPLYIPISNFLVQPFVSIVDYQDFKPVIQESEVEELLIFKLQDFFNPENRITKDITTHLNYTIKNVPCFFIDGHIIWGATAMMMSEFLEIYKNLA